MVDILEEWKSILNALIAAPVAWQSPTEIAAALGRGVEETTDLLSVMDEANWVSVWDVEPGPLITLSTLAAHRLKVVLVEVGPEETPRWMRNGRSAPGPPKAIDVSVTEHHARQVHVVDPEPSAEHATGDFERRAASAADLRPSTVSLIQVEDLPPPILLLGQGLSPWPGPGDLTRVEVCPACAGRRLLPHVYCLVCDRWGLDEFLDKLSPTTRRARTRDPRTARFSTPNESAASVAALSPARPGRSHEPRPFQEAVSRNRARRDAGREARRSAPVGQR